MESLVVSNVKSSPIRFLVTAFGVAIGTVLILLIVGLAHGVLKDRGARESNMAAEIIVRPAGSFTAGLGSNTLSLPVNQIDLVRSLLGVQTVTPVGQYIQNTDSGIGFRVIDAVDFDSYTATTGVQLLSGRLPTADDEVVVDEEYSRTNKAATTVDTLDRKFKITGIYSPSVGARIKIRLTALQTILAAEGQCTMFLVRCQPGVSQETVAANISRTLPEVQIIFVRDLPRLYANGLPALNVFLQVLVGLAIFVSTLVILLAMYTAIIERTREIGILKSLGASRKFIIWAIEKEALLISFSGVVVGYLLALITRFLLMQFTSLRQIEFEWQWLLITTAIGLLGGLLGALYPAIYASRKDPVEALSYE
jgi:putative ABC transport system permease protein